MPVSLVLFAMCVRRRTDFEGMKLRGFEQPAPRPDRKRRYDAEGRALVGHAWESIRPLSAADRRYDFGEVDTWRERWDRFRARPDAQPQLRRGLAKLERLWSIETGIIEGLYTLNRGTTTTLLEHGFVADVIRPEHTNIDPGLLLAILRDHEASVELVHGYIREERPLSPHTMRELHACIVAHQDTHLAVDSLGRHVHRPLRKGAFKMQPNNPTRTDGRVHQYAPPEQVDSEIARLVDQYRAYDDNPDIHPLLCAAWLHHRFVQIHPFADGNGRTARALMNWHLIKRAYLPIAVADHNRVGYIHALELADAGDLSVLVRFLCKLTRSMVYIVVGDDVVAADILGPAVRPGDRGLDDYPGRRK